MAPKKDNFPGPNWVSVLHDTFKLGETHPVITTRISLSEDCPRMEVEMHGFLEQKGSLAKHPGCICLQIGKFSKMVDRKRPWKLICLTPLLSTNSKNSKICLLAHTRWRFAVSAPLPSSFSSPVQNVSCKKAPFHYCRTKPICVESALFHIEYLDPKKLSFHVQSSFAQSLPSALPVINLIVGLSPQKNSCRLHIIQRKVSFKKRV